MEGWSLRAETSALYDFYSFQKQKTHFWTVSLKLMQTALACHQGMCREMFAYTYIAVKDRMLLRMQDFDFAQIKLLLPKFHLNFAQIQPNVPKFNQFSP